MSSLTFEITKEVKDQQSTKTDPRSTAVNVPISIATAIGRGVVDQPTFVQELPLNETLIKMIQSVSFPNVFFESSNFMASKNKLPFPCHFFL